MKYLSLTLVSLLALGATACSSNSDRTKKEEAEPIKGSLQWCRMYHDPATSGERKPNAARYCEPTFERDRRERDESILNDGAKVEVKKPL
ncbi:hypothetical protein DZA50_04560 [Kangiella sp. HD9-110m-PIT-SAG07]|nr:hypothetical protein DZA50_04560 [Kangiella sp. HD9-110m-PIT-SAG07]